MDMGQQVTATVDEDLYDNVCEEHTDTGKSKSQVVNDRLRDAYESDTPSLGDTIIPIFGQGLFVAGFIVALIGTFIGGVGMAFVGLGLMVGAKVDEYMTEHNVPATTALIRVLGA